MPPMPVHLNGTGDIYNTTLLHEQLGHSTSIGEMSPSDMTFLSNFDGLGDPSTGVTVGTGSNTIVLPPGISLPKKKSRPTSKKADSDSNSSARSKRKSSEPTGEGGSGRWTKEEDAKLRSAVAAVGAKNWKRISQEFLDGRRSDVQCLHRWNKVLKPGLVKGPWTQEEDEIIRGCITEGITKWSEIAAKVPGRIGKQCRERWFNHLDPSIKKSEWSEEEDQVLISAQAEMGNKWCEIAKLLPGRSENAVKNRWNSATRRKQQFGVSGEGASKPARRSTKSNSNTNSNKTFGKENSSNSNRRGHVSINMGFSPAASITPTAPIRAQLNGGLDDSTSPSWGALLPGDMSGSMGGMGMGSNFGSLGGLMAAGLGGISLSNSLDPDDGTTTTLMSNSCPVDPLPMASHLDDAQAAQAAMPPPATMATMQQGQGQGMASDSGGQQSRVQHHEKILANLFKTEDTEKATGGADTATDTGRSSCKPSVSAEFAAQEAERLQLFSGVSLSTKEKQKMGLSQTAGSTIITEEVNAAELEEVSQFDLERMFDLLPSQAKGGGGSGGKGGQSGGLRSKASGGGGGKAAAPGTLTCTVKSEGTAWAHMNQEGAPPAISIPAGSRGASNSNTQSPGMILPGFTPPAASTRVSVMHNIQSLEASLDDLDIAIAPQNAADGMFPCAPLTA